MKTTLNKIRALAEAAKELFVRCNFGHELGSKEELVLQEFMDTATPGVVLALLDELAASKEANRVALFALSMPCDRWNGMQAKIVSAAITKLKEVLK